MRKSVIAILFLFFVSVSTSFASQWTVIRSMTGNPVQCNKWGWVHDNVQTAWNNSCTPLEVQSLDGSQVFSIPSTENTCQDDEFALFAFLEGDTEISFYGCYSLSHMEMMRNMKR